MSTDTSSRSGILAGGNWIVDHVKILDGWPPQDALANILSESWGNGGSPYNILKNLAKLTASFPLAAVGLVGDDADGDRVVEDCRQHAIDTTQLRRTANAATAYSDVMTDRSTGRRTFFHQRGANALLAPEHFDFSTTSAKIFHLGYLLLLDSLDQVEEGKPRAVDVFRRARAAGLLTSLDCVSENSDRFDRVVKPVLPEIDVLFVNDFEAEKITGIALRPGSGEAIHRRQIEDAAQALIDLGVRQWVIIHFPEAAYAVGPSGAGFWQASLKVVDSSIKGAAGAGDAFASGVLHELHEGRPIADALLLGVCTAASSLSDATCSDGVLPVHECLQLHAQFGTRELPNL